MFVFNHNGMANKFEISTLHSEGENEKAVFIEQIHWHLTLHRETDRGASEFFEELLSDQIVSS